ncbi:MAG TPA: 2,3-bisphosphoglycerate-independent phosphoglycerate mutase, partial [Candidatus Saccharimonadales bacterium]|nr:2,3-bisphosphoglycerate-independent phosphoglycerate mutase [Candidatus Saccharimonadales bacterium]
MKKQKTILMILDGWGIGKKSMHNAVSSAKTPELDYLFAHYPHSELKASGLAVGLPAGIMGNSEVGHLNIGAGRIVYQDLVKINKACTDGSIGKNKVLLEALHKAKQKGKSLHFIGLVSDAGVHSNDKHLYKMCDLAKKIGVKNVFIHAIADGRDTDPQSGLKYISRLENHLQKSVGQIATLIGRYYTMDRDKHWERIKKGYEAMVSGKGELVSNFKLAIKNSYSRGITDEFMEPKVKVDEFGKPIGLIKSGDVVICFNFRTERLREITIALTQRNFPKFKMKMLSLNYYTLTGYDNFKKVKVIFEKDNVKNTLGEVLADKKFKQLRLAETEKYAHVTFFFSGGRDKLFLGEKRILINSPRIATYDLQPEMSEPLIAATAVKEINKESVDFICLNIANCDMVGHTGIFKAIVKAVEAVDIGVGQITKAALAHGYELVIIADHGNAESAVNKDGSPNTAHSLNLVPCLLVSSRYKKIKNGALSDVAPTILKLMDIKVPKDMTGRS